MTRSALIVLGVLLIGTWTADTRADPNAERALKTANGLLERGLATEAIPEYRAALEGLESTGSLDEARYGLALSLFRTGAYADALETLDEIVGGAGFAYTADSASLRAHALHRTGRHADAAQAFARFTDEHPNHAGWVSAAALAVECTHRAGDHRAVNRLARRYEERLKGTPAGRRSAFFSAVSHSIRGLHDEAAEGFETLALGAWGDPITEQSTLRLAQSLEQLKRPTDAKQAYERATEAVSDPVRMDAIIGLASMLREDGKAEQALRMLNDLRKGSPGHRPERVSLELGLTELGLGRPDAASALFDEIKKDPALLDDAAYWTSQAESAAGKPALAAQRLERSIEVFPQSPLRPRMMYDLGVALQQAGEGEDARDAFVSFRGAYDRHALVPDALHAEAALLLNAGELEEAADRAQEMLRSHGDHPKAGETAFILAESSYRNGRTDRAAVGFAALLDRLGSMPEADTDLTKRTRYRLGMSLHAEDRDAEAEPHLRAVTAGQDTEARFLPALAALGNAAFDAGAWEDAIDALVAYLGATESGGQQTAGEREDAMMRVGLASARLERHDDALTVFDQLSAGEDTHATHALFESGQCLVAMGREDDAAARFQRLLDEHPGSRYEGHALRHLGSIAMRRGDSADAESYLARAGTHFGDDGSLDIERVRALLELGRSEEALEVLGSRSRNEPAERSAWWVIALAREGRHREAVRTFERMNTGDLEPSLRAMLEFEASRSLRAVGRGDDAEETLRRIADGGGAVSPHAAIELASILCEDEHHEQARAVLAGLLESSDLPESLCATALYQSVWASHQLGDHDTVVSLLDPETRRCDLGPMTASGELLYGESLLATGRPARAAERFAIVVTLDGDADETMTARLRLADSHAAAQSWTDSREAYVAYLEQHTDSPLWFRARFGLGWSTENGGDPEAAIEHYRLVTDDHRGETAARAQFQIGECLFALGRHEEAVRELLRVDILHAEPEWSAAAVYEAGRCFEAMGKVGEARAQYRDVVDRFGESDWAKAAGERLAALQTGRVPGRGGDE